MMRRLSSKHPLLIVIAVTFVCASLLESGLTTAHHSYAMFDRDKEISTEAVVRTWEFTSPHATLWIYINDASGAAKLWGIEAPGPAQLVRSGWDKDTVKAGDKIKVTINPLRDGRNGGSLIKLVLADGRSMNAGTPTVPGAATNSKTP